MLTSEQHPVVVEHHDCVRHLRLADAQRRDPVEYRKTSNEELTV